MPTRPSCAKSMKIGVFTEYYPDANSPASGVYVHVRALAYMSAGHDVRVFRVRSGAANSYEYGGVTVVEGDVVDLKTSHDEFEPNVLAVHTPHPGSPHTRLAESLPTRRVLWVHGYEAMLTALHGYHQGFDRALSLLHDIPKLWQLRRSLAAADAVVFVSRWIQRAAQRGTHFRHRAARVIPNPVDLDRFRPAQNPRDPGPPRGLVLRPLNPAHGVDVAVAAFAGLTETELTIIGEGPDAGRLRELIRRLEAPVRLEERSVAHDDVPGLLTAHDYLIAPERKTPTQGVAMCEAMACGLPVIAVRAGGVPEYARDSIDGFLVRRGDAASLRRAVLKLVADPERARAMGRSARDYVCETCSADRVIAAELETLAGVAG